MGGRGALAAKLGAYDQYFILLRKVHGNERRRTGTKTSSCTQPGTTTSAPSLLAGSLAVSSIKQPPPSIGKHNAGAGLTLGAVLECTSRGVGFEGKG